MCVVWIRAACPAAERHPTKGLKNLGGVSRCRQPEVQRQPFAKDVIDIESAVLGNRATEMVDGAEVARFLPPFGQPWFPEPLAGAASEDLSSSSSRICEAGNVMPSSAWAEAMAHTAAIRYGPAHLSRSCRFECQRLAVIQRHTQRRVAEHSIPCILSNDLHEPRSMMERGSFMAAAAQAPRTSKTPLPALQDTISYHEVLNLQHPHKAANFLHSI